MAYDEDLADRIRELLAGDADVTERKMFGGLAFLVGGNMAVAASGQGGLLVRVDPAMSDDLVASTGARPMEMRGREMRGWLRVDAAEVRTRRHLAEWVALGTDHARTLPAKR
jgi:TfoX/Sxy family transcriptional regulator of competence genes